MEPSSSLDRHLSSAEEAQLAEALELRRKQIDREIAEYTADKEKEFRKFEKRLRSEKRDAERLKILQCEREVDKANVKRRGSKTKTASAPNPQRLKDAGVSYDRGAPKCLRCKEIGHTGTECKEEATLPDVHRDGEGHRARDSKQMPQSDSRFEVGTDDRASAEVGDTRSNGVRFGGATEIPREGNADRKSHKSKDGALKNEQAFHEREVEFQGLFTPTFLPLLSGGHQETVGEAVGDKSVKQPSLIVDNKATQPLDAQCQCNPASTIAPIYGSEPLTPANPRHLSSSDPRKVSMSERRSSSRSDTSVRSLRSSLRDAKQPRSPKKVLFSIDNVVVSPSTSPTLQRRIAAGNKSDIIEVVSKLDAPDMVVGKADKDFDPYAWRRDAGSQSTKSALTNIPYTNGHANGSSRPQHPAAQIGVGGTSPSMGGDGFEHIRGGEEDDELFAFDEDISYRDRSGFVDGEAREEEVEADGLDTGSEELPTNSPHAGSLPIEIRWPARKDPRG